MSTDPTPGEVAEVGAYARAMETIRDLRSSNARHAQAHARTTRELRSAEAKVAELRATVERVGALANEWTHYPLSVAADALRAALTAHRRDGEGE